MQYFKATDVTEQKFSRVFAKVLDEINSDQAAMYAGAFQAAPLGDVLWELDRSPLARAVPKDLFREIFWVIDQYFTRPGTFEFYLDVFRVIFGDSVSVTFAVPEPGVLTINVNVLDIESFNAVWRQVVGDAYVYSNWVDHSGNQIVFQVPEGPKTEEQFDRIMSELATAGIYTVANLALGP